MKLLAIETSCDETALAVLDFNTDLSFSILSELINSQIDIHKEYGGVYPAVAKREHTKNIYPLFIASLDESSLLVKRDSPTNIPDELRDILSEILDRDPDNLAHLLDFYTQYEIPALDAVAVTYGPGLEIALWTGFNFAKALAAIFDCDLVPTNHMEGHIYASLIQKQPDDSFVIAEPDFPRLSLLISGGHTELVLSDSEHNYTKIGKTLDDAVGEAYDKSARLIGIPYPGGPEVSKRAEERRDLNIIEPTLDLELPRPMLHTKNLDFSFSGLKTAVLQMTQKHPDHTDEFKRELAFQLEEAIAEVLTKKTKKAIAEHGASSLIIGGGVSANTHLRREFTKLCESEGIDLFLPDRAYTGDNAVMIGVAGYRRLTNKQFPADPERVIGSLSLESL